MMDKQYLEDEAKASDKSDAKETADASTGKTAGCEKKAAKQFGLKYYILLQKTTGYLF